MNIIINPYRKGSKSVRALKNEMGVKSIKFNNSNFKPRRGKIVINWGSSNPNVYLGEQVLNPPVAVSKASNKLLSFIEFRKCGVRCPPFTQNVEEAKLSNLKGSTVYCRHTLVGNSGEGIEVIEHETPNLPHALLYVIGIPIHSEYRVHVVDGKVIDYAKKGKRRDLEEGEFNPKIRNYSNGYIFMREGVELSEDLSKQAIMAVNALGLNFGAVDIVVSSKDNLAYVLEVNTACGLQGTTVKSYAKALDNLCQSY